MFVVMPCPMTFFFFPSLLQARSQAYRDSLREEENRKLQKMKEEQHQKVFVRPSLLVIANYLLVVLDNFERFLNRNIYMHENPEKKITRTLKIESELQVCFKTMVAADAGGNAHSTLPQRGPQCVCLLPLVAAARRDARTPVTFSSTKQNQCHCHF